jgi:leucyl-tRNA synthetase
LRKLWRVYAQFAENYGDGVESGDYEVEELSEASKKLLRKLHQTIKKVGDDLERIHQNTAIAAVMELLNSVTGYVNEAAVEPALLKDVLEKVALLLAPFAPHFAEEVWERLGHAGTGVVQAGWPEYDAELAQEDQIEFVVQINGKVRSKITAAADVSRVEMETLAMADQKTQTLTAGKTIFKVIVVPGKLVNIVVRG